MINQGVLTVRGNHVSGGSIGIAVEDADSDVVIAGNTISGVEATGILIEAGMATAEGNVIEAATAGFAQSEGPAGIAFADHAEGSAMDNPVSGFTGEVVLQGCGIRALGSVTVGTNNVAPSGTRVDLCD